MNKFWFTTEEVLDKLNAQYSRGVFLPWFKALLEYLAIDYVVTGIDATKYPDEDIEDAVEVLMQIVMDRHFNDYAVRADSPVLKQWEAEEFIYELLNILNVTVSKYIPQLVYSSEVSEDPFKELGSKSINDSRFNDTPQNGGSFANDPHATTVSHSENETKVDSGSVLERLKSLYSTFDSVMLKWSNEFNRLFVVEDAING